MFNITKIENGFEMNSESYILNGEAIKIGETQAHVLTEKEVIFFDISVSIDNKSFESIDDFIVELYR
jgi:hypothetical protein